ncbi:MAG TPA: hypothetical protein VK459_02635, partial [Polyangiaceae bacterium]|nr:hypothetical protein [Polyangiaceae bacterium]
LDSNGSHIPNQPPSGLDVCPAGSIRAHLAVSDIHIGVVSSSIGGHGADACPDVDDFTCAPNPNFGNNDKGHLLTRLNECGGGDVPTYQNMGFLAWDPTASKSPPGETNLDNLIVNFKNIVTGVGQIGCGYESQLEGWYRFLVDPEPYETISAIENKATPSGIDQTILLNRKQFLRPDSLLVVMMLSDENDCSTKEFGQFFFANQLKNSNGTAFHLPRARQVCATNPNDPCCKSCGQDPGNCPPDPTCLDANGNVTALTESEDSVNLRCFDQKRRFGIDLLNPVDRYVDALTSTVVPNRAGELVPNPIFSDLDPTDNVTTIRDPGLVVLATIVGVPWQDIAKNPADLTQGYKSAAELSQADAAGNTGWDIIVGSPGAYVPPLDPLMVESIGPRSGTNPATGAPLVTASNPLGNPVNGHEWSIQNNDDLQYACIFDLPEPRDCNDASIASCDCRDGMNDNPLCAVDPSTGQRTLQVKAKAYPGLRHLEVAKSVNGVVASVCPKQITDPAAADYAYRPAVQALLERVSTRLKKPTP